MFGQNPIITNSYFPNDGEQLRIVNGSPFVTIQGEGPYAGKPATFVRLWGCNLTCHFCFVGNTRIATPTGNAKIKDVNVGDSVVSFDGEKFVIKKVTKVYTSETKELVKVLAGNKTYCTTEHPFLVTGKGWVEARALTAGDKIVQFTMSDRKKYIWNPMWDADTAKKAGQSLSANHGEEFGKRLAGLWNKPDFRAAGVARMTEHNPMKDPAVALKGYLNRTDIKKTTAELKVESSCADMGLKYVGDGQLVVGHKVPDFVFEGTNKLVEVYDCSNKLLAYRDEDWVQQRTEYFAQYGYECLCIDVSMHNKVDIRQTAFQYLHNGRTVESVEHIYADNSKLWVRLAGHGGQPVTVYNLEVEDTHNYVANGMVVHNCDTNFSDPTDPWVDAMELAERVNACGKDLVVVTGGEPSLQNLDVFLDYLMGRPQIETNGTTWKNWMGWTDIVVSPKTTSIHATVHDEAIAFKYVVSADSYDPETGLPIIFGKGHVAAPRPGAQVYLSPCDEYDVVKNKRNMDLVVELCQKFNYTVSLQLHKILGLQ